MSDPRAYGYQWRAFILEQGFASVTQVYIAQDMFKPGAPTKVKIWKLTDFDEYLEGDFAASPSIQGPSAVIKPFLQSIVDEAWRNGIKPTQLAYQAAENRGQQAHLDDMRAIVAKNLKVELPQGSR